MRPLRPDEYNQSYFQGGKHPAGYSDYARFCLVYDPRPVIKAADLYEQRVLDVGCGMNQIIGHGLQYGIGATSIGMDSSKWCLDNSIEPANHILGDATEPIELGSFDVGISSRFLVCLSDGDIQRVIENLAACCTRQVHFIDTKGNADYYKIQSIEEWQEQFDWPDRVTLIDRAK